MASDTDQANLDGAEKRTQGPQTYTVQIERELLLQHEGGEAIVAWVDLATVTVPPRTPRKTVIKRALAEAKIAPSADGSKPRLRALDVDSFETHEPEAYQPPPEWRL